MLNENASLYQKTILNSLSFSKGRNSNYFLCTSDRSELKRNAHRIFQAADLVLQNFKIFLWCMKKFKKWNVFVKFCQLKSCGSRWNSLPRKLLSKRFYKSQGWCRNSILRKIYSNARRIPRMTRSEKLGLSVEVEPRYFRDAVEY